MLRGREVGIIFPGPMTSLNPDALADKCRAIKSPGPPRKRRSTKRGLLERVGIPQARERVGDYPHQFYGGMRQRVMIAMAISCQPKLLIADEPTTALDVTIQAQIVDLVRELQAELGMAIIWITHDLGVIARLAKQVNVMYAGTIVESAPIKQLFKNPSHPYTLGLLKSLPGLEITDRLSLHRRRRRI